MKNYFLQLNEFLKETGGSDLSWSDWQNVGKLSLDLRKDLIETKSIRRITGYKLLTLIPDTVRQEGILLRLQLYPDQQSV